jgi:hypothetical protein
VRLSPGHARGHLLGCGRAAGEHFLVAHPVRALLIRCERDGRDGRDTGQRDVPDAATCVAARYRTELLDGGDA